MHDSRVNQLTHASFDPHSRQPSYKHSGKWRRGRELNPRFTKGLFGDV
jgi:hypothetical protein